MKTKQTRIEELKLERNCISGGLAGSYLSDMEMDPAVESLMDSMHYNPLGRLLEVISMLPEVRVEKVEKARQEIEVSDMCSDTRMDVVLDRILEEIVVED